MQCRDRLVGTHQPYFVQAFSLMVQCLFNFLVSLVFDVFTAGPLASLTGNKPGGYGWLATLGTWDVALTVRFGKRIACCQT